MHAMDKALHDATTWSAPLALTILPTLVLFLQCCLLFVPPTRANPAVLSLFRKAVLPICLYTIWQAYSHPVLSFFLPRRDFVHLNLVLQVAKYWGCIRSVEYAFADSTEYAWMGYGWAYDDEHAQCKKAVDGLESTISSGQLYGESLSNTLWLAWRCGWTLRGIGWSWEIRGKQIPAQHPKRYFVTAVLFRLAWAHIVTVLGYIFLQYCRENDVGPETILYHYSHLPPSDFVSLAGRPLQVAAFAIAIYTAIEVAMCYVTLLAYFLTNLLRHLIPESLASLYKLAYYLRPDPFRIEAWPKLSFRPFLADSVSDFWGRRWHPLFKRQFVAVGFRPLAALAASVGLRNRGVKLACGALGAFFLSGFIHESINDATEYLPRDVMHKSATFFVLQTLALTLENTFTRITGKRVGGPVGRLWAWAFLLITGMLLAGCWWVK